VKCGQFSAQAAVENNDFYTLRTQGYRCHSLLPNLPKIEEEKPCPALITRVEDMEAFDFANNLVSRMRSSGKLPAQDFLDVDARDYIQNSYYDWSGGYSSYWWQEDGLLIHGLAHGENRDFSIPPAFLASKLLASVAKATVYSIHHDLTKLSVLLGHLLWHWYDLGGKEVLEFIEVHPCNFEREAAIKKAGLT